MKTILTLLLLPATLLFAQSESDPDNPIVTNCCACGGTTNPFDSAYPTSEGNGCGESEEVAVNDDGTLNIVLEPIPEGCDWIIKIKDADGKEIQLPVKMGDCALPIRVEYRCNGASDGEAPCKVKCYTCSEESCDSGSCSNPGEGGTNQEETANKSVYVRIPVGYRSYGDHITYLRLHLPENQTTNPGPAALTILSGNGYSHTMNNNGTPADPADDYVDTITCQFGYASIAMTPTSADSKSYTVSIRTSPSAGIHRTIKFEHTGTSFRVTSTFSGKTHVADWHLKTGTTHTLCMDKGYMNGTTFEILRTVEKIVSQPNEFTYVIRFKTLERPSNAASGVLPSIIVADTETTYVKYAWSWQVVKRVIDPDGAKLATTYRYYQSGDTTGPGLGRLRRLRSYDGYEEVHTYDDLSHTILTPFKDDPDATETTTQWNAAFTEKTHTRKVNGILVGKTVTSYNSTTLTYTEKTYTNSTSFLTASYQYYPTASNTASSSKIKKIINPDGTASLYEYSQTAGGRTTITKNGAFDGTNITEGESTTRIAGISGNTAASATYAIGTGVGITLNEMAVQTADSFGRPTLVHYFPSGSSPAYTTSSSYDCCGLASSTDKYGIVTSYVRDGLGRTIKINSLEVTQETLYDGLTIHTLRYGEAAPPSNSSSSSTSTHEIARSVRALSGSSTETWSRSPQTGAMVKYSATATTYQNPVGTPANPDNLPAGIGQSAVQQLVSVADDSGVPPKQTTTSYLDRSTYESTGNLSPNIRHGYAANTTGMQTTQSYLEGAAQRETVTTQTDWLGRTLTTTKGPGTTTYTHTGDKLTKIKDADNVSTFFFYNSEGEREKTVLDLNNNDAADDSADQVSITKTYPGTYTPPGGSATDVITTKSQAIASGTDLVTVSTTHRTPDGLEYWTISSASPNNPTHGKTTFLTGAGNWKQTTTHPDGTKIVTTYTSGLVDSEIQQDSANGTIAGTTYTTYDAVNRPTVLTDSRTGASTTAYFNLYTDTVSSITDSASRTTSFTHDHRGRRTLVNAPDTGTNPNVIANETTTRYFIDGTVKEITGDQTYRTTYTYDYAFRRKSMTTYGSVNASTYWDYSTTTGQLTGKRYNDNTGPIYTYTNAGRLETRQWQRKLDPNDNQSPRILTSYGYAAGRLNSITYNDSTPDLVYTHDRLGRPDTVTRGGVLHADYDYDSTTLQLDQEKLQIESLNKTLTHTYEDGTNGTIAGRPNGYTFPDGAATWTFDAAGRHQTATDGTDSFTYGYEYDLTDDAQVGDVHEGVPPSQGTQSLLPFTLDGPKIDTTFGYDLTRDALLLRTNTNGSTLSKFAYTVNAIGQRTNLAPSGSAFASTTAIDWGHNTKGELVSANRGSGSAFNRSYAYDGIGNRLTATDQNAAVTSYFRDAGATQAGANPLNQYARITYPGSVVIDPVHDLDGNMTSGPVTGAAGLTPGVPVPSGAVLKWDAENRLVQVVVNSVTVDYQYDHLSRLIRRTQGTAITQYLYEGFNRIAEYNVTTNTATPPVTTYALVKTYLWGLDLSGTLKGAGGVGGLLSIVASGGSTRYYPAFDGNGNVSEYVNQAGTKVAHFEYDPFGNLTVDSEGNAADFPYRFSTKPQDFITGLYYYGYRYYDPVTGRWPSRDPIGEKGGFNLYETVGNSPIEFIDYLGLEGDKKKSPWEGLKICYYKIFVGHNGEIYSMLNQASLHKVKLAPGSRCGGVSCTQDKVNEFMGNTVFPGGVISNFPQPPGPLFPEADAKGFFHQPRRVIDSAVKNAITAAVNAAKEKGCKESCCDYFEIMVVCLKAGGVLDDGKDGVPGDARIALKKLGVENYCGKIVHVYCNGKTPKSKDGDTVETWTHDELTPDPPKE